MPFKIWVYSQLHPLAELNSTCMLHFYRNTQSHSQNWDILVWFAFREYDNISLPLRWPHSLYRHQPSTLGSTFPTDETTPKTRATSTKLWRLVRVRMFVDRVYGLPPLIDIIPLIWNTNIPILTIRIRIWKESLLILSFTIKAFRVLLLFRKGEWIRCFTGS